MIAFVRSVIAALDLGRIEVERRRVDVGEDRASRRARAIASAVAKNVNAGQITSSPGPIPSASSDEHERVGAVGDADRLLDAEVLGGLALEPSTSGPKMKRPLSSARANASFSSGMSGAYCALTSTSGIGCTPAHRRWSAASGRSR